MNWAEDPATGESPHKFLGLSPMGWTGFMVFWVLQAAVFWNGMESIKACINKGGDRCEHVATVARA